MERLEDSSHGFCLGGICRTANLVPEDTNPLGRSSLLGTLLSGAYSFMRLRRAPQPPGSRIELATIGGQVGVSVGCHEKQSSGLSAIIPVLQLPRLACEAVKVITDNRIEELGLKVGETAYAVIKASNVMVGADH